MPPNCLEKKIIEQFWIRFESCLSELFVQMTRSTFWKIIDLECVPTCVHEKKAREKKE